MKKDFQATIIILTLFSIIILSLIFYKYFLKGNEKDDILKDLEEKGEVNILFLHHRTGKMIWDGGVPEGIENYDQIHNKSYNIIEQDFPKKTEYGWNNYPFDYWNIWVNHAGNESYKNEPTLEMITKQYDVVVFKHSFPVSNIKEDTGVPNVGSDVKNIENYKLQYQELKEKLHSFSDTKFIVWTGAALVEGLSNVEKGERTRGFFEWVKDEWDEAGDNIFIWDFYELETEGGYFLKNEYAKGDTNAHPNSDFAKSVAPLLCNRIVDVIEGRGDSGNITGKSI